MIKAIAASIASGLSILSLVNSSDASAAGKGVLLLGHGHGHPTGTHAGGGNPGGNRNFAINHSPGNSRAGLARRPGFVGGPVYNGYADQGYANSCNWLHIKAEPTGSQHWWNRFQICLNG